MSINVVVGSDPNDANKLQDTVELLYMLKALLPVEQSYFDIDGAQYDSERIDDIIDWYKSMYNILTNPSFALTA
jgi:hypothetical protein